MSTVNPKAPLSIREEVARPYVDLPQTRRWIAQELAGDPEAVYGVEKDGFLREVWNYWRLDPAAIGAEARERLVRAMVADENRKRLDTYRAQLVAVCDSAKAEHIRSEAKAGRVYERLSDIKSDFGLSKVEGKVAAQERELRSGEEAEVAARLEKPAKWEFAGGGRWRDTSTSAEACAEGEPGRFSTVLHLVGGAGTLVDVARRYAGPGVTVVLTDGEVTAADEEAVNGRCVRFMRLGPDYRTALQAKLDSLKSPIVDVPEV